MSFKRPPASKNLLKHPTLSKRVDGLKGMAWAYAACHAQEKGPSHMGSTFKHQNSTQQNSSTRKIYINGKPKNTQEEISSNVFYQYLKGKRAPVEGKRGRRGYDLVGEVHSNVHLAPAKEWFYHPLWKIFCKEPSEVNLLKLIELAPIEYEDYCSIPQRDEILDKLKLDNFDTFIAVCAAYRLGLITNNAPLIYSAYELIIYLTPQASIMDVTFNYIHKPFLKMISDFFPPKSDESRLITTGKIIHLTSQEEPQFTDEELEEIKRLANS